MRKFSLFTGKRDYPSLHDALSDIIDVNFQYGGQTTQYPSKPKNLWQRNIRKMQNGKERDNTRQSETKRGQNTRQSEKNKTSRERTTQTEKGHCITGKNERNVIKSRELQTLICDKFNLIPSQCTWKQDKHYRIFSS